MEGVRSELGLEESSSRNCLAALALIRMGRDSEKVASQLTWNEFEDLCARLLSSNGYDVRRNIVLTKPRKQIDILAVSSLVSLAVDCKHYGRRIGPSSLARFADNQLERARLYKQKVRHRGPVLPVILTLMDEDFMMIEGVPVVPLLKLKSFLLSLDPTYGLALV